MSRVREHILDDLPPRLVTVQRRTLRRMVERRERLKAERAVAAARVSEVEDGFQHVGDLARRLLVGLRGAGPALGHSGETER